MIRLNSFELDIENKKKGNASSYLENESKTNLLNFIAKYGLKVLRDEA